MGTRAALDAIPLRWRQRVPRIDAPGRSGHVEWWRHEAGGDEIDDVERAAYRVLFENGEETAPMAVADLGDGDNNHELCLESDTPVRRVSFPAGLLTDPREDLNPATSVTLGAHAS